MSNGSGFDKILKAEVLSLKERNQSLQENFPPVSKELIRCENAGGRHGGVCGRVRGREGTRSW